MGSWSCNRLVGVATCVAGVATSLVRVATDLIGVVSYILVIVPTLDAAEFLVVLLPV